MYLNAVDYPGSNIAEPKLPDREYRIKYPEGQR